MRETGLSATERGSVRKGDSSPHFNHITSVLKYIWYEIKRVKLQLVNRGGTTCFREELSQEHIAFAYT